MEIMVSLSALNPSVYRKYVKGWDKGRYADVFKKFATGNAYRVYLPLLAPASKAVFAPLNIVKAVEALGYTVEDYRAGVAVAKDGKRRMRIGKLLKDPALKKEFDNDPVRKAYKSQYMVCVSRHPYDIAGSSTNRGWTSCMNLKDGENRSYVKADVKFGSIVAYLIEQSDTNITRPAGRVLIKPFYDNKRNLILRCEGEVYGTTTDNFVPTVQKWLDTNFNHGIKHNTSYVMDKNLYNDTDNHYLHMDLNDKEFWEKVNKVNAMTRAGSFNDSNERDIALERVPDILNKLDHVSMADLMSVADHDPQAAVVFMVDKWSSIVTNTKRVGKGEYTPEKFVTKSELQPTVRRLLRKNKIAAAFPLMQRAFKFDEKELAYLISENSRIVDFVDLSNIDVIKLTKTISDRADMEALGSFYDHVVKTSSDNKDAVLQILLKDNPSILNTIENPPFDLVLKYWKDIKGEFLEYNQLKYLPRENQIKLVELATQDKYTASLVVNQISDSKELIENEDFIRVVDDIFTKAGEPSWLIKHGDDFPVISKWSGSLIKHLMEHNAEAVLIPLLESSKPEFYELKKLAISESPMTLFTQFYYSELGSTFELNPEFARIAIDALAKKPRIVSSKEWAMHKPFSPKMFQSMLTRAEKPDIALSILDYFLERFCDKLVNNRKRFQYEGIQNLFTSAKVQKLVIEKYPRYLLMLEHTKLNTLNINLVKKVLAMKPQGTPTAVRELNGFIAAVLKANPQKVEKAKAVKEKTASEKKKLSAAKTKEMAAKRRAYREKNPVVG